VTLLSPRRRRRRRVWRPDGGRLICSACGGAETRAPAEASICCAAPVRHGAQRQFLQDLRDVYEVLNAGSVGGGKTDAGLMAPVMYQDYRNSPAFRGLILRHWDRGGAGADKALADFYQRIQRPGNYDTYARGRLNQARGLYTFAKGGSVTFTHSAMLRQLQGPEFQYLWLDELTHWPTADDYLWVLTRLRSSTGLPIRVRAGTNAGGPGHEWVRARWGPWLASNYLSRGIDGKDLYPGAAALREMGVQERRDADGNLIPPLPSGAVLWYVLDERGRETWVPAGTPGALSRSCLRTKTADNVVMNRGDAAYATRTRAVAAVKQGEALHAQLTQDDWMATAKEGDLFKREDFGEILTGHPPLDGVVRIWDFAYTAPPSAAARRSRDWTVGAKMGWTGPAEDRTWYILHIVREQRGSKLVKELVKQTAGSDGIDVPIFIPRDYAAGAWVGDDLSAALAGYSVKAEQQKGKKESRIDSLATQVAVRRVRLAPSNPAAPWVQDFLDEAAGYPEGRWDDQLDAVAEGLIYSLGSALGPTTRQVEQDVSAWGQAAKALEAPRGRGDFGGGWDGGAGGGIGRVF